MDDGFFNATSSTSHLDLAAFFDSDLAVGLCGVLDLGVLVSLGLTRDGGALGVAIFDNGRRRREYFRRSEDATEFLRAARDALSAAGIGRQPANGRVSQNPTRGPTQPF